jgi:hypothetical protein
MHSDMRDGLTWLPFSAPHFTNSVGHVLSDFAAQHDVQMLTAFRRLRESGLSSTNVASFTSKANWG